MIMAQFIAAASVILVGGIVIAALLWSMRS